MFILVIITYIPLLILELMTLYKKKYWQDFWVNLFLGSVSFIIALLISLHVKVPSPAEPIKNIILSMFGE
ncbi:hypothetical protein [Defluviitalea saccharophila]|uniref:Uncharacterized protein n=1 Tax=Defluviitalea saccharophila TaxID=879970 RepID=A0ABZ2Y5Y0_9FIRM|nr:hypothetical protein [Candidatus Epulonipiscium sp.]